MRYKLENDRLIPAPLNFRTPEGSTICNFNLSPEVMARYGYTVTEEEAQALHEAHPAPAAPVSATCTKYRLITVLRERFPELLAALRQAYAADADLQFWWNSVNELDRNNADFAAAAEKLGIDVATLDAVFAAAGEA